MSIPHNICFHLHATLMLPQAFLSSLQFHIFVDAGICTFHLNVRFSVGLHWFLLSIQLVIKPLNCQTWSGRCPATDTRLWRCYCWEVQLNGVCKSLQYSHTVCTIWWFISSSSFHLHQVMLGIGQHLINKVSSEGRDVCVNKETKLECRKSKKWSADLEMMSNWQ